MMTSEGGRLNPELLSRILWIPSLLRQKKVKDKIRIKKLRKRGEENKKREEKRT